MTIGEIYKTNHENNPVKREMMFNGARGNLKARKFFSFFMFSQFRAFVV